MRRVDENKARYFWSEVFGKDHRVWTTERMCDQHVRRSLSRLFESSVQIVCNAFTGLRAGLGIAPHYSRTAVGACASESCDRVMDSRPPFGTADVQSVFEHHSRSTGASTIHVKSPTSDVDQLAWGGEVAG